MNFQKCSRCNKHYAIMNITKVEGDKITNQALCPKCAKELGLKIGNLPLDSLDFSEEAMNAMDEQMESTAQILSDPEMSSDLPGGANSPFNILRNLLSRPKDDNSGLSEDLDRIEDVEVRANDQGKRKEQRSIPLKYLDQYCINLTRKAREGKLDAVIGRDREIFRTIQILCRRTKNNPCLIGDPGVGKTAIAEGIAIKIANKEVPEKLANKELYLLDLTALVAGTQFRGQFEGRVKGLLEEIKRCGNIILVIDEVHNLVGTGDSEGTMSAANMMKPALSRGDIQVLGATTLKEYRKHIEKDSALERRFQPVVIEEPSISEAIKMLAGIKKYYEEFHRIKVPDFMVERAVQLSERYITDRFLPDKAIDLIDEACSNAVLKNPVYDKLLKTEAEMKSLNSKIEEIESKETRDDKDYEQLVTLKQDLLKKEEENKNLNIIIDSNEITIDDLYAVIELWTGIPASKISADETDKLKNLKERISERIVGQDKAIDAIVAAVKRGRISIVPRKRPISFIFTGPTGVGKTEVVKVLARELFDSPETLIRLDMSEFMEKHSVSRLIGSPPGYIGYDEAGQLTEKIRRKPYSVILFDEIEKAHPDVLNVLLQILDDGVLTDAHGVKVSFEHTLIVMTSNAGSNIKGTVAGFNKTEEDLTKEKTMKALGEFLRPEFINRVDEIITFSPLPESVFPDIVKIQLSDMNEGFKEKGINFEYTNKAVEVLAKKSFSREYGARNVRRIVQKEIEDKVVNAICDSDFKITNVKVTAKGEEISILIS